MNQIYELPLAWSWANIGTVTKNFDGRRVPLKVQDRFEMKGTYPYYGASGAIDSINDYLFDGAYLLITEDGNLLSKSNLIAFEATGKFWVNNHAHVVQSYGCIPLGYLKAYVNHFNLEGYVTGTTRPKLTQAALNSIPIPLPPLAEQRRIVAAIETQFTRLDASVAALRRARANLKRYRASVLKDACEGRLVPTEAELASSEGREYEPATVLLERILAERRARWESQEKRRSKYKEPSAPDASTLPELPEGWVWASLESLSEVRLGRQRSPKRAIGPNMHPYLRAANVTWEGLDLSDVKEMDFNPSELETYRLEPGDILLGEASGSPDEVGKPAVWDGPIGDCCFQNTLIRVRADSQLVAYLFYHLLSDARSGALGRAARGVGIHHLGAERMASWAVALPPLAEQRRIVAEVDRRLSVIQQAEATVEASLARAERLRQSILKQAFSGRLVPQDPDDEPASALLERMRAEREAEAEASRAAKGKSVRGRGKAAR